jgi:tetratricopeptide (TPR) repeat protein
VALGLALGSDGGARERIAAVASAVVCGAAVVLTGSRGGLLSLCAGMALLALFAKRGKWLVLAAAMALASALLWRGASVLHDEKLRSFAGAAQLVRDHWLSGLGRGAYRFLSDRHRSVPGDLLYVYAENEPLQLAAELGVPAALAVLGATAWAFLRGARRPASGLSRGALAALAGLALHNLVDFNLELIGVALPAALALGALAAPPVETEAKRARPLWARSGAALVALAVAGGALLALRWAGAHSAEREAGALVARVDDRSVPLAALLGEARALLVRHPADALIDLAAARALHERAPAQPGRALLWVNRAMALSPTSPRPHALAAAILGSAGARSQARLELKLALSGGRYQQVFGELLTLATQLARGAGELWEATPDDAAVRAALIERLQRLGRRDEAQAFAERELARLDALVANINERSFILVRLAAISLERGDAPAALRFAERLSRERPSCEASEWLARAERAAGKAEAADALVHATIARCPQVGGTLLLELVESVAAHRGPQAALDELRALSAESPGSPRAADARLLHARLLEQLGRPAQALEQRWLAAELAPERPELAVEYADRLLQRGERAAAEEALRSALRRAPPNARGPLQARLSAIATPAAAPR